MVPILGRGHCEWGGEDRVSVLLRGAFVCFIWNLPEIQLPAALLHVVSLSLISRRALALRLVGPVVLLQSRPSPRCVPALLWLYGFNWCQFWSGMGRPCRARQEEWVRCELSLPGAGGWSCVQEWFLC